MNGKNSSIDEGANHSDKEEKDDDEKAKLPTSFKEKPNTRPKRKTRSSRSASKKATAKLKNDYTEDEGDKEETHDENGDENESTDDDTPVKEENNDETDDDEEYDQNEKDDDEDHEQPKKKQKRGKGKKTGKEQHKCPHCAKTFTSEGGLKYHICRFKRFSPLETSDAPCTHFPHNCFSLFYLLQRTMFVE